MYANAKKQTGIRRSNSNQVECKKMTHKTKQRLDRVRNELRREVIYFMEREDDSMMLPGKNDATKDGDNKRQTRILTDYMANIHKKFTAENPTLKISLAMFYRLRTKYIN